MARSLTICDSEQTSDEDDAVCPECRKIFANDADGFWKCVMAVTVGVTLVVQLCPSKKPCLNSPFVGAAFTNCDFHNLFRQQLFCFEDFVMGCA